MTKQQITGRRIFINDKQLAKPESLEEAYELNQKRANHAWRNDVDAAQERTEYRLRRSVRHGIRSDRRIEEEFKIGCMYSRSSWSTIKGLSNIQMGQ